MRVHRSVYRGYAIYVWSAETAWSFRAEPLSAELPILPLATFDGHDSRGGALKTAKSPVCSGAGPYRLMGLSVCERRNLNANEVLSFQGETNKVPAEATNERCAR
jgi:hypothetical protein